MIFQEFKPAFLFVGKFLGLYLVGNILYGIYIESFDNRVDSLTYEVTEQTAGFLGWCGEDVTVQQSTQRPTVSLLNSSQKVISVFEGCNGVNVMIVFVSFMIAFGGPGKALYLYTFLGLVLIHLVNIGRVSLLYYTAKEYRDYFYYLHKYFFTAILYGVVFMMWAFWIYKFNMRGGRKQNV